MVINFVLAVLSLGLNQPQDGWKRYELADAQMSLELPDQPKRQEAKLREDARQYIVKLVTYQLSNSGVFYMLSYTEYTEGIAVDLHKAAEGAIINIKNQAGVTDARFSTKDVQRDDKPGVSITGYYSRGNQHLEYNALVIGAGRQLWQVGIGFADTSMVGKAASKKLLGSVLVGRTKADRASGVGSPVE